MQPVSPPSSPEAPAGRPRGLVARMVRVVLMALLALFVMCTMIWSALFLRFAPLPGETFCMVLSGVFVLCTIAAFVFIPRRKRTLIIYCAVFASLVAWYFCLLPSNDRLWVPEVARLAAVDINGDLVTVSNIRNFEYRTAHDFTPRYYDKTFDLNRLESTDLMCVYWGSKMIAHVIVSFGFGDGEFIAFSIEMRSRIGQSHSLIRSFFRNYELVYVVADERDVVRLRTNFREPHQQVHLYRTRIPIEDQRRLFVSYVEKVDQLSRQPEWYNTLDDNCTTGVLQRIKAAYHGPGSYNWKILLNGYTAEYCYEIGMIDTSMPFAELSQRCLITPMAQAAGSDPNFSLRIREGLPLPSPYTMHEFARRQKPSFRQN